MSSTLANRPQPKPTKPARGKWLGLAIAAVIVAGLALAVIYFFGAAEPAEVDLDSTVNAVAPTAADGAEASAATSTPESPSALTEVSGDWSVDTTTGTFSFEAATATFAGFRVQEEVARVGAATAVGRTPGVSGTVTIDGTSITQAEIEVDLTAIVSDESRRENAIREALNTNQNPTATFVLTETIDFGEVPTEGVTVSATATGDLTINGVTRTVEVPLKAQVTGESILVVGSTTVIFADYEIETPSAPGVLSVAGEGTIELQLWLVRA